MHTIGDQIIIIDGAIKRGERRSVRTLAIEAAGDFCYGKVTPKIRLAGRWLERAGFRPGHRVEVISEQAGTLTLRFIAKQSAIVAPQQ